VALGAATVLTSAGSTSNIGQSSPFTTAAVTMTAGRATFVGINHSDSAGEGAPTAVASSNVTFTFKESQALPGATDRVLSVWWAVPAGTVTEAINITLADDGTGCAWIVFEKTGAAATPIVGTPVKATDTDADVTATHGALQSASNHQIALLGLAANSGADTPSGTGWSAILSGVANYASPDNTIELAENTSGAAQAVTFSGAGADDRALIVFEVAAATSTGKSKLVGSSLITSNLLRRLV
jgi:hypothetical protein